ncbi:competence protein [Actinorhabdospora filicis]|uniref:Competence protein n=1 Tax=Actinorhabdospora filicis TaxID=1785913 RepID=A0A9W6SQ23_9ACTN|nr:nicotinamide-nucleotide amidohydrolase family protein [Actinorhabdospora filicis]GLZ78656.1 competence protein [Actinorhabdospora filicis]
MSVAAVVETLASRAQTVATAESLTGGLLAAELVSVPGVSAVFRGGVVAYDPEVKTTMADVPAAVIAEFGVVSEEVAAALATGARTRIGADWGLGTTGVAGPGPHDGVPAGTVCLGVAGPYGRVRTASFLFSGSRERIRRHAVDAALRLLSEELSAPGAARAC